MPIASCSGCIVHAPHQTRGLGLCRYGRSALLQAQPPAKRRVRITATPSDPQPSHLTHSQTRRQWLQTSAATLLLALVPQQALADADDVLHVGPAQKYTTIMAAVAAASPGATIVVDAGVKQSALPSNTSPNRYNERLVVDKSLKLTPFSPGSQVVVSYDSPDPYQYVLHVLPSTTPTTPAAAAIAVAASGGLEEPVLDSSGLVASSSAAAISEQAPRSPPDATAATAVPTPVVAEVSGILFKHSSKSVANNFAVYVQGGSLVLRDCDVTSSSGAGVAVEGGNLQMLRCAVHDCAAHGVAIFGDLEGRPGRVLLQQCSISGNKADGVLIRQGARPIIKDCTIILNKGFGMQLLDCTAVLKDNLVQANGRGSIVLDDTSVPLDPSRLQADNKLDAPPVLLQLR